MRRRPSSTAHHGRATDLRCLRDVVRAYARAGSARVLVGLAAVGLVLRLAVGGWSWGDPVVLAVAAGLTGFVEWVVHRSLLHAPAEAWVSRVLDSSRGHRNHHADPADLYWAMLRPIEAGALAGVLVAFSAVWALPVLTLAGLPLLGPWLTAVVASWAVFAHYEWTHLLVHGAHRPRLRYYRRLARNHRRHHHVDARSWLGVTSNLGDRVLGTLRPR